MSRAACSATKQHRPRCQSNAPCSVIWAPAVQSARLVLLLHAPWCMLRQRAERTAGFPGQLAARTGDVCTALQPSAWCFCRLRCITSPPSFPLATLSGLLCSLLGASAHEWRLRDKLFGGSSVITLCGYAGVRDRAWCVATCKECPHAVTQDALSACTAGGHRACHLRLHSSKLH